jgi:hypothetical protein
MIDRRQRFAFLELILHGRCRSSRRRGAMDVIRARSVIGVNAPPISTRIANGMRITGADVRERL